MFTAHISEDKTRIQTATEHCTNVANYAYDILSTINLGNVGYLAGILHDCGKFTDEFEKYINKAANGEPNPGKVIHTFAGVYYMMNKYHKGSNWSRRLAAEIIALAIGSHHGLIDIFDVCHNDGFKHRLKKQPEYEKRAINNFLSECISEEEIDRRFELATVEIDNIYRSLLSSTKKRDECYYYVSMLSKIVIAAVIEADRRDTAEFMYGETFTSDNTDWHKIESSYNNFTSKFNADTAIQIARKELSDKCYEFANNVPGIYRLNIPTGGGKTLSGLRYAIRHSQKYNKNHIFYVAPLITILEQNADVIREAIGGDNVLEFHSNTTRTKDNEESSSLDYFLEETWEKPVIVTTLVQILMSLFSKKTESIRRISKFTNSTIIFDEVQSIPKKLLSMFNLAINFLAKYCNATIILCSATQPTFDNMPHSMDISNVSLLAKDEEEHYYNVFKRNNIVYDGKQTLETVPEYVMGIANNNISTLVVCNKVAEAVSLYNTLKNSGYTVYHLSSNMCIAHRRDVLAEIREKLDNKENVICVSTQVIEAGVDISFETVIRYAAGIDNIVQTAGRCNRNGDMDISTVHIVNIIDEKLSKLKDIQTAKDATIELLHMFEKDKERFDSELDSAKSIEYYYDKLFRMFKNADNTVFDFSLGKNEPETIYEMLSTNHQYTKNVNTDNYFTCQALKTAGEKFDVFDTCNTTSAFVYYKESRDIIAELLANIDRFKYDRKYIKGIIRKLKPYTITLYDYQEKQLENNNNIIRVDIDENTSIMIIAENAYGDVGLDIGGNVATNSDDYIF